MKITRIPTINSAPSMFVFIIIRLKNNNTQHNLQQTTNSIYKMGKDKTKGTENKAEGGDNKPADAGKGKEKGGKKK